MKRALICMALSLSVSACGGATGNTGSNSGGSANATNTPSANTAKPGDDGEPDPSNDDPGKHRKVKGAMPDGWRALSKDARGVLERHFKAPKWEYVTGVLNTKPPGATEGDEEWGKWEKDAAGAMLYFVSDKSVTPKAIVEEHAKNLAAGEPAIEEGGGIAWTQLQGGEILVCGISNKYGTYVVVGVVLTAETETPREMIRKWAESIKPE